MGKNLDLGFTESVQRVFEFANTSRCSSDLLLLEPQKAPFCIAFLSFFFFFPIYRVFFVDKTGIVDDPLRNANALSWFCSWRNKI